MIESLRKSFNNSFTQQKYAAFKNNVTTNYHDISFRLAETPVFIPENLKQQLIAAGDEIIALIKQPNFKTLTQKAIPAQWHVPNESSHPNFLAVDFAITKNEVGVLTPQLIELQGFPSLFGFQDHLATQYKDAYNLPEKLSPYFNIGSPQAYINLLKQTIVGNHHPKNVVLMDVNAHQQKTAIDFYITAKYLGIKVCALSEIKKAGNKLYYVEGDQKIEVKRIYNRLIFDEVAATPHIFDDCFDPRAALDVEWVTHPNWFYRVSKYILPLLKNKFTPETHYLNTLTTLPTDLENYVLKPLFSFAGKDVLIDVTAQDVKAIKDPENWILQRKVVYEPVINTPSGSAKVEIRLMYVWPNGKQPKLCINLARLSKGKMIGVDHNKQFDWVGGTVGLML